MTADVEQEDALFRDAQCQDNAICVCQADRPFPFQRTRKGIEAQSRSEGTNHKISKQFFVDWSDR
jgi:hypothetical protein